FRARKRHSAICEREFPLRRAHEPRQFRGRRVGLLTGVDALPYALSPAAALLRPRPGLRTCGKPSSAPAPLGRRVPAPSPTGAFRLPATSSLPTLEKADRRRKLPQPPLPPPALISDTPPAARSSPAS